MENILFSLTAFILIYLFYLITVISRKNKLDKLMEGTEITYLKRLASFTNPKFYELQKLRMPIFYKTTPRIISCFEEDERFLKLPRGCIDKVLEILQKHDLDLSVRAEKLPLEIFIEIANNL